MEVAGGEPDVGETTNNDHGEARWIRIDEAAQRTGLTKRAIRFYEEEGLLSPAVRSEGGYRLFTARDVERLQRISRLKHALGISLQEIRELLEAEDRIAVLRQAFYHGEGSSEKTAALRELAAILERLVSLISQKIEHLEALRDVYREKLTRVSQLQEQRSGDE